MRTWRPSYCACVVEEVYSGQQITGAGAILAKCADHADIADAALYDTLLNGESRPAMAALKQLETVLPGKQAAYSYRGTGSARELVILLTEATQQERSLASREIGKVVTRKYVVL